MLFIRVFLLNFRKIKVVKTVKILLYVVFGIIATGQLTSSWLEYRWMEYTFKPLILGWIIMYYLLFHPRGGFNPVLLFAFILSWAGDILLMFAWKSDVWFFGGVGAFFIAQAFFILAFLKPMGATGGMIRKRPWFVVPFVFYLVAIFILVYPGLVGVMIPVVGIYAISLVLMAMAAFNRLGRVKIASFTLVFLGAVSFVVSDSLLAFNKFLDPLPRGGFIVMAFYITAQLLIVEGMVRSEK